MASPKIPKNNLEYWEEKALTYVRPNEIKPLGEVASESKPIGFNVGKNPIGFNVGKNPNGVNVGKNPISFNVEKNPHGVNVGKKSVAVKVENLNEDGHISIEQVVVFKEEEVGDGIDEFDDDDDDELFAQWNERFENGDLGSTPIKDPNQTPTEPNSTNHTFRPQYSYNREPDSTNQTPTEPDSTNHTFRPQYSYNSRPSTPEVARGTNHEPTSHEPAFVDLGSSPLPFQPSCGSRDSDVFQPKVRNRIRVIQSDDESENPSSSFPLPSRLSSAKSTTIVSNPSIVSNSSIVSNPSIVSNRYMSSSPKRNMPLLVDESLARAFDDSDEEFVNEMVEPANHEDGATIADYELIEPDQSFSGGSSSKPSSSDLNTSVSLPKTNWTNNCSDQRFKKTNFHFSDRLMDTFRNVFRLSRFRTNQLEAINAALLGHDCFLLMPTGGGKSLCYQLPASIGQGVTIVVSPLKSLIHDQVTKLDFLGINVRQLTGDISFDDSKNIFDQLRSSSNNSIKLLYVTPERIAASNYLMSTFEQMYKNNSLDRFVIDEAHCVSQWGHDFRPDYKKLHNLRNRFPKVPIMAVTATANPRVRHDVVLQLKLRNPKWFLQSFNRPNLKFVVKQKNKDTMGEVISIIRNKYNNSSGIIYCLSRKDCEKTAQVLRGERIKAREYHAGLKDETRIDIQNKWISGKILVICATIAFGMGVDKPDVRFVIHLSIAKSIEGYYQESGRAGRDGKPADCILYFGISDVQRLRKLIQMDKKERNLSEKEALRVHIENLNEITFFASNTFECRRVQLLRYLGESFDQKECKSDPRVICDNCSSNVQFVERDVTKEAKIILECILHLKQMGGQKNTWSMSHIIDIVRGSQCQAILSKGHEKSPFHGNLVNFDRKDLEFLMRKLVCDGYLVESVMFVKRADVAVVLINLGPKAKVLLNPSNTFTKITIPIKTNLLTNNQIKSNQSNKVLTNNQIKSNQSNKGKKKTSSSTRNGSKSGSNSKLNKFINISAGEEEFLDDDDDDDFSGFEVADRSFNLNGSEVADRGMEEELEELDEEETDVDLESECFGKLMQTAFKLAKLNGVKPDKLVPQEALVQMAAQRPTTANELLKINGITPTIHLQFGDQFLEVIREFKDQHEKSSVNKRSIRNSSSIPGPSKRPKVVQSSYFDGSQGSSKSAPRSTGFISAPKKFRK